MVALGVGSSSRRKVVAPSDPCVALCSGHVKTGKDGMELGTDDGILLAVGEPVVLGKEDGTWLTDGTLLIDGEFDVQSDSPSLVA